MENIFHFQGKRRLSQAAKHYTIQPCFSDNEGNSSSGEEYDKESSNNKDSANDSPTIPSKKSHFSNNNISN